MRGKGSFIGGWILVSAMVFFLLSGCAGGGIERPTEASPVKMFNGSSPGDERRAELWHMIKHECGACHGLTRKGGLGPSLLASDLKGKSSEALAAIVMYGIPEKGMPPWRHHLSEDEIVWIVQVLKGIETK
jgi:cytochrome c55X